jgi:hypothetical protein
VLTATARPEDGETVTIGTTVYTWRTTLTDGGQPNEVKIGTSTATALENLEHAINYEEADEGIRFGVGTIAHPLVSASRRGTALEATALETGTEGNSIATSTDATGVSWGDSTLSGGAPGVLENCNGSFAFEDSVWSSAVDDEQVWTKLPPDSLKGSVRYDHNGDLRPMTYPGRPYDAGFLVPRRDDEWRLAGLPVPRVWCDANSANGEGSRVVLDRQRMRRALDLHPHNKLLAHYAQPISPWTGNSIQMTGAPGEALVTDDNTFVNTQTDSVAMMMHGLLGTPTEHGILFSIGNSATGSKQGPFVQHRTTGKLRIVADTKTIDGVIDYDDGEPHTIVAILDHGNVAIGQPSRLLVVTDQEIIDFVNGAVTTAEGVTTSTPHGFPTGVANGVNKGLGATGGSSNCFVGYWRLFAMWSGADVRRIRADGAPGAWEPGDIIPLLRDAAPAPPMPTFLAMGPAASGPGDPTPAWPAHEENDIGLLFVETSGGQAITAPSGWTPVTNSPQEDPEAATRLSVFWRRATSSSEPDPTVTNPADHIHAVIGVWRYCRNTGNPWLATACGGDGRAFSHSIPAFYNSVANLHVVLATSWTSDDAGPAVTLGANPNLANVTERYDSATTVTTRGIVVVTGERRLFGSTGATPYTLIRENTAVSARAAYLAIGLKP